MGQKFIKPLPSKKEMEEEQKKNTINLTNKLIVGHLKNDPNEDYSVLEFLGEGSFASVFKVQHKLTGQVRAMKVLKKSKNYSVSDDEEIINEISILMQMDHPSILKIFEFYSNEDSYSMVTELCSGGELFQDIIDNGPFNENYCAYVMYQILSAINHCHSMNIIHRDLKPENILIVKKDPENNYPLIKVCDFGTAKMLEKGAVERKVVGSSYYIAPEVLKKRYDEKCDLWSCGVILYILLSGRPPFPGDTDNEIYQAVSSGVYDLTDYPFDQVSEECKDLIKSLLVMDAKKRISAEMAINHPWFKLNQSKELFNEIKDSNQVQKFIENLKTYKSDSIIQETALAYLVHNYSLMPEIADACKLFNMMDATGDGKINKKEFYQGLQSRINSTTLDKDVDIIFANIDADNNGYIQYEEFVRAAVNKEFFLEESILKFAFRYFDKDNSGEITFDEIKEVFEQSINDKTQVESTLRKIISDVDIDKDGKIQYEEFTAIMKKLIGPSQQTK